MRRGQNAFLTFAKSVHNPPERLENEDEHKSIILLIASCLDIRWCCKKVSLATQMRSVSAYSKNETGAWTTLLRDWSCNLLEALYEKRANTQPMENRPKA